MSNIYGWHFVGEFSRGGIDPIGVVRTEPAAKVGRCGLHFSPCALEALRYAKAPTLQRVRASGTIVVEDGGTIGGRHNHAAPERTALATIPGDVVSEVVRVWLFRCIENHARPGLVRCLRRAAEQDSNAERAAIATLHADTIEMLPAVADEVSCEAFRVTAAAAWAAARDAAWDAAGTAAGAAAGAAAWAAAGTAARAAARAAAGSAAWAAAWDAAWTAARDAAWTAARAAAWTAARAAAWTAAWDEMSAAISASLMSALTDLGYDASQEVAS